jgi:polar amino acid transport system substrate-binding protein
MMLVRRWVLGLVIALVASAPAAAQSPIRFLTEDLPPLNYTREGVLKGLSVEIVRAAMADLGHPDTIELLPWPRALQLAQTEPGTALFSTTRTAEREGLFRWVGPLTTINTVFLARRERALTIHDLLAARTLRIGVTAGAPFIEPLQRAGFTGLDAVSDPLSNPRKLRADRIDLWLVSDVIWPQRVREAGLAVEDFEAVFTFGTQVLYIAFNRATDDATITAWQRAIDRLTASGQLGEIVQRYRDRLLAGRL